MIFSKLPGHIACIIPQKVPALQDSEGDFTRFFHARKIFLHKKVQNSGAAILLSMGNNKLIMADSQKLMLRYTF